MCYTLYTVHVYGKVLPLAICEPFVTATECAGLASSEDLPSALPVRLYGVSLSRHTQLLLNLLRERFLASSLPAFTVSIISWFLPNTEDCI